MLYKLNCFFYSVVLYCICLLLFTLINTIKNKKDIYYKTPNYTPHILK